MFFVIICRLHVAKLSNDHMERIILMGSPGLRYYYIKRIKSNACRHVLNMNPSDNSFGHVMMKYDEKMVSLLDLKFNNPPIIKYTDID